MGKEIFVDSDLAFPLDSKADSLPCCVFHQQKNGDDHPPKVLTYASLGNCLDNHKEWLLRTIRSVRNGKGADNFTKDVVVAYISGNSMDMLASVLVCASPALNPAIPALLNIRWTSSEMIASLRSKGEASSGRSVITIVLHDGSYTLGETAERVAVGLRETHGHSTRCIQIPSFSNDYLETFNTAAKVPRGLRDRKPRISIRMQSFHNHASHKDALILFTSGTTGGSKGVRLSHRALLIQSLAKLGDPCGYSEETAMLATTVPLFHVGGLSSFLAVLLARGKLIFPARDQGRTNISSGLRHPFTPSNTLVVVPAMLASFFASETQGETFLDTRFILIGGQSASSEMLRKIRSTFPNAQIAQTYACTEAASSMTFLSLTKEEDGQGVRKLNGDCVGTPPDHIALSLFQRKSDANGNTKPEKITKPYELGLIATYGPHVMNGYWKRGENKQSSSRVSKSSRLFISTDLGFWDDRGRLCFGGRAKDVVRTGGETVLAQEVEKVLIRHPWILECAVFPRKDDRYGEAVACAIVPKPNHEGKLGLGALKSWCHQEKLAGYKRPKYVILVESLPRNSSGKVLKHKLVAQYGEKTIQSRI